jgi:hypothetical protein
MPKGDANRHTFEYRRMSPNLAYLVGVYLGDGYCDIRQERYGCLRIGVVDIDFLLEIQRVANEVLGFRSEIRFDRVATNENSRDRYIINICCSQFALWLVEMTGKKAFVPTEILQSSKDIKIAFLQGLMDSEACITRKKRIPSREKTQTTVLFAVKSEWIHDVWRLCGELGAKPSPILKGSGIYRFAMTPKNYAEVGLTFNILRKREILYDALTPYKSKPRISNVQREPPIGLTSSRLSDEDVIEIRRLISVKSYQTLSEMYHVSDSTIRRIVQGKTFRRLHDKDEDSFSD